VDLARLGDKCARLQWSVDDLDWDAPGAERVDDAQALALGPFMADLYWIELVASTVFGAMAQRESDPLRRAIFETFAADEKRHAEAELQLMVRWGIMGRRQTPRPNPSVAKLLRTLERDAHRIHPSVFSAVIPMTELVLDGALVKYLMRSVDDPLCHRVFEKINADEARHLAMDFHMLEHYGKNHSLMHNTLDMLRSVARPEALYALFFGYFPTLARSRASIERMGLDIGEVATAMRRYVELGQRNPDIARHPTYRLMSRYVQLVTDRRDPLGHALARISDAFDGFRASPDDLAA
jgi:hypothetical protein